MSKHQTYIRGALTGIFYGMLLIVLSRCFIRNLGGIFNTVGEIIKSDEELVIHITQALEQLKTARIVSPWFKILLIGIIAGILYFKIISRNKRKILLSVCLWTILLIPLMLGVVCFTEVNDMRLVNFWLKKSAPSNYQSENYFSEGDSWNFGFGRRQIIPDEESTEPLYIAGYNNGVEITAVLDYCEARAVWLDTGKEGVLLIGIDCVALDSGMVHKIRDSLKDLPNCASVNVYSTHTHAGIDTLGMWGPIGIDGKNDAYMEKLIQAAEEAGREAAENRTTGNLYFGQVKTEEMLYDSRIPEVFDENMYQLRFEADDSSKGLRLYFYGAHAESLRGSNKRLSRDFPGMLCDKVTEATGDNTMFFPGAIGGLIMTEEFRDTSMFAAENMEMTADKLVEYALSIDEETEQKLTSSLALSHTKFVVPMDNIAFWLYKYLGILNNKTASADSATGYGAETEMAVLMLDNLAITLIPGEIFPELVLGGEYGDVSPENENPESLRQIAAKYGIEKMLVIGLANDEIGYIVPPSDFLVNESMPYIERTMDYKGEDHYEETNSIGKECANVIAETFETLVKSLRSS